MCIVKKGVLPLLSKYDAPKVEKISGKKVAKPVQTRSLNVQVIHLQKCHEIEFLPLKSSWEK